MIKNCIALFITAFALIASIITIAYADEFSESCADHEKHVHFSKQQLWCKDKTEFDVIIGDTTFTFPQRSLTRKGISVTGISLPKTAELQSASSICPHRQKLCGISLETRLTNLRYIIGLKHIGSAVPSAYEYLLKSQWADQLKEKSAEINFKNNSYWIKKINTGKKHSLNLDWPHGEVIYIFSQPKDINNLIISCPVSIESTLVGPTCKGWSKLTDTTELWYEGFAKGFKEEQLFNQFQLMKDFILKYQVK